MAKRSDAVRKTLMLEPRGHRDMTGAMLTEPVYPGSHAGLIFMNADGYPALSGHAVMAATLIALDRGLLAPGGDGQTVVYDTAAGIVRTRAATVRAGALAATVSFTNVPSFVLHAGVSVKAGGRQIRADVAFGGAFYAIVDAESAGVSVDAHHVPLLRQLAQDVIAAIESTVAVVHPLDASTAGLAGTLFTGPPAANGAHLRNVTVLSGGSTGRAPSGTGMSAVMAVLDAMGLLGDDEPFQQEGLSGAVFQGRMTDRTTVGDHPAIVPEITGSAWITGEQVLYADPTDPFAEGLPP
jgi:proline racemase